MKRFDAGGRGLQIAIKTEEKKKKERIGLCWVEEKTLTAALWLHS